jgi:hypothetical protein
LEGNCRILNYTFTGSIIIIIYIVELTNCKHKFRISSVLLEINLYLIINFYHSCLCIILCTGFGGGGGVGGEGGGDLQLMAIHGWQHASKQL